MNKYDAPDRSVDEIRLGTSLADVTPVPEPTTLGLFAPLALILWRYGLVCGGAGLIRRRLMSGCRN